MFAQEIKNYGVTRTAHPLRVFRVAANLSQAELAAAAGISRQTVLMIEGRRTQPMVKTARALASALNCDPHAIFPEVVPANVNGDPARIAEDKTPALERPTDEA